MGATDVLDLYGVKYQTEGHKHCRPGWANMPCPFCSGNPGLHLGIHIDSFRCFCWRCGWHPTDFAISKICNINIALARTQITKYRATFKRKKIDTAIQFKPHHYPKPFGPLPKRHRKYLESRLFDPDKIISEWNIAATGPGSFLDRIDFSFRILIPIVWDGKQVSFQARDVTNTSELRYISCPKDRELIQHKHILYGRQEAWTETAIIVEGVTDAWRLGPNAVATFGIEYTPRQVRKIAQYFKRIFIMFDDDPQAKIQGKKLAADLRFRGLETQQIEIIGDPGDMDQGEADYYVRQLTGR